MYTSLLTYHPSPSNGLEIPRGSFTNVSSIYTLPFTHSLALATADFKNSHPFDPLKSSAPSSMAVKFASYGPWNGFALATTQPLPFSSAYPYALNIPCVHVHMWCFVCSFSLRTTCAFVASSTLLNVRGHLALAPGGPPLVDTCSRRGRSGNVFEREDDRT